MQNINVQSIEAYYPKYSGLYTILIRDASEPGTPRSERERIFVERLSKLKEGFVAERTEEYATKKYTLTKRYSCTSSTGNTNNCSGKARRIHTPHKYMRTDFNLTKKRGSGTLKIEADGQHCRLKQRKSGDGRKVGHIDALFKYRNDLIDPVIKTEMINLFARIARSFGLADLDISVSEKDEIFSNISSELEEIDFLKITIAAL